MKKASLYLVCILAMLFAACTSRGVFKNLNTGLSTRFEGMSTENADMVMNDEKMNNADVPLGASFTIMNSGVHGLVVKNNKQSIGCSLTYTDKQGKVIFSAPDLFQANDVYDVGKTTLLKCTINTGQPMIKGDPYTVTVVFFDKYGTGKIKNEVTIKSI